MSRYTKGQVTLCMDGIPVVFNSLTLEMQTYDLENIEIRTNANVKAIIDTDFGFITVHVNTMRREGNVMHLDGILRTLIPSLFTDKELKGWQIAYLDEYKLQHLRYTVWTDDEVFQTSPAYHFMRGYEYRNKK